MAEPGDGGLAYVIGVGVAALVPPLGGFDPLPAWRIALGLIVVLIVALLVDHVVERVADPLITKRAAQPERSRFLFVDVISGAALLAVLALGLQVVMDSAAAFVAALIIAVLAGVLPALMPLRARRA